MRARVAASARRMRRRPFFCRGGKENGLYRRKSCRLGTQNAQNRDFLQRRHPQPLAEHQASENLVFGKMEIVGKRACNLLLLAIGEMINGSGSVAPYKVVIYQSADI